MQIIATDQSTVKTELKKLRKKYKITQQEVADHADCSMMAVHKYEKWANSPSWKMIAWICNKIAEREEVTLVFPKHD